MNRRSLLVASLVVTLSVSVVYAGRGRGRMRGPVTVVTPYGAYQNPTSSAEWRQAGGNPAMYQQLMQRKMAMYQQQVMTRQYEAMKKQQQAYEKWYKDQKAKKDKGQATDPAFDEMLRVQAKQQEYQAKLEAQAQAKIQAKQDAIQRHKDAIKAVSEHSNQHAAKTADPKP